MLVSSLLSLLTLQLAAAASIPPIDSAGPSSVIDAAHLFKRYPLTCGPRETLIADAAEAARAIDYLRSIGHRSCTVPAGNGNRIEFKRYGRAVIRGHNVCQAQQTSSCNDVARGAGLIMDRCT